MNIKIELEPVATEPWKSVGVREFTTGMYGKERYLCL